MNALLTERAIDKARSQSVSGIGVDESLQFNSKWSKKGAEPKAFRVAFRGIIRRGKSAPGNGSTEPYLILRTIFALRTALMVCT